MEPTRQKPGPKPRALTLEHTALLARFALRPGGQPSGREMARVLGITQNDWQRQRPLSPAQIEAGNVLLDQHAPTVGGVVWHQAADQPLADPADGPQ